jgi:hypothetical protein
MSSIQIPNELTKTVTEFALLQQQIKELETRRDALRKAIDVHVTNIKEAVDEELSFENADYSLKFSAVPDALKFNYDIKGFIAETQKYECVSISVVEAKKHLSEAELCKYFITTTNKRKLLAITEKPQG